jgi:rhodanese-related sulfurtransferase
MNRDGLKLAELGVGESFGEESLISVGKRNATITMQTDGALVRLGKDDFKELLNEPLLHWVDLPHAKELVERGAMWLDVRLPSEFETFHLDDAINVPLYFIRLKVKTLDQKLPYICVCDTSRRSSAAAFLLSERGFDAYCLQNGMTGNNLGPQ